MPSVLILAVALGLAACTERAPQMQMPSYGYCRPAWENCITYVPRTVARGPAPEEAE